MTTTTENDLTRAEYDRAVAEAVAFAILECTHVAAQWIAGRGLVCGCGAVAQRPDAPFVVPCESSQSVPPE